MPSDMPERMSVSLMVGPQIKKKEVNPGPGTGQLKQVTYAPQDMPDNRDWDV